MKTNEIKALLAYSNGKGAVRVVLAAGEMPHMGTSDTDYVWYEVVEKAANGGGYVGQRKMMTRNSFAKWARERAPEHDRE